MVKKTKEVEPTLSEQVVTLDDVHNKVVIVINKADMILAQQNTIAKENNVILAELSQEFKKSNESRDRQTEVFNTMANVLGKVVESRSNEQAITAASQEKTANTNSRSLLILSIVGLLALLLVGGIITMKEIYGLKDINVGVSFPKE